MKKKYIFGFILALSFIFSASVFSQSKSENASNKNNSDDTRIVNPLYDLRISNIQLASTSAIGINTIVFDIYIYHKNLPESGPFEYSAGQYYLDFNPDIANGGTLTYSIVPNSTEFTNPDAAPIDPSIDSNVLRLFRNEVLGSGNGPIVSAIYPGTRVVRMKLVTTSPTIDYRNVNLAWRDSSAGDPYTQTFAYIDDTSTNITGDGTLIIDSAKSPLPVELNNFNSIINRNNLTLNWSTNSEFNNSGFEVQRSVSNDIWSEVVFVNGNGNSTEIKNYTFEDKNLNSGSYKYRLKQIDFNGNHEFYYLQNDVIIGVPNNFNVTQNYPNPFNPSTTINFDLPFDSRVNISIFDMSGREVFVILNEAKSAGYYTVNFNSSSVAGGLSSGIYFYRVNASGSEFNSVITKKMILLK